MTETDGTKHGLLPFRCRADKSSCRGHSQFLDSQISSLESLRVLIAQGSIAEATCSAGKPPSPAEPPKQPKALLQQHCQSAGLPMPQYARQAPGGGRAEAAAAALATEAAASDRVASSARAAAVAETADEHASAAESQQADLPLMSPLLEACGLHVGFTGLQNGEWRRWQWQIEDDDQE